MFVCPRSTLLPAEAGGGGGGALAAGDPLAAWTSRWRPPPGALQATGPRISPMRTAASVLPLSVGAQVQQGGGEEGASARAPLRGGGGDAAGEGAVHPSSWTTAPRPPPRAGLRFLRGRVRAPEQALAMVRGARKGLTGRMLRTGGPAPFRPAQALGAVAAAQGMQMAMVLAQAGAAGVAAGVMAAVTAAATVGVAEEQEAGERICKLHQDISTCMLHVNGAVEASSPSKLCA